MKTRTAANALMLILCAIAPLWVAAQSKPSLMDVLQNQELARIQVEADLSRLMSDIQSDEWVPATVVIRSGTFKYAFEGKIRLRGRFRRMNCDFPPLKLKIPKSQLAAAGLEPEFNDFKIVTHCLDDRYAGNALVLREYLVYRFYNALTPNSYRTQLARMTWVDRGAGGKKIRRFGFLIEDTDELAARMQGVEEEKFGLATSRLSPNDTRLLMLFQELIGNDDWDLQMARNVKFIYVPEADWYVPVPYDFDFADFVAAPYARPGATPAHYELHKSLQNGLYHSHMARYLLAKKQELAEIITSNRYLPESEKETLFLRLMAAYKRLEQKVLPPAGVEQKSAAIVE